MTKKIDAETQVKEDPIILVADTMVGDLRDFLLDRLKHNHSPLPWNLRPEAEQRETISQTETAVRRWVHQACATIAANGHPAARASLVKFQAKDGIQMQINMAASDPMRHALMDHVGGSVLVVIADPEQFNGERAPAPINKDQPDMLDDEASEQQE